MACTETIDVRFKEICGIGTSFLDFAIVIVVVSVYDFWSCICAGKVSSSCLSV